MAKQRSRQSESPESSLTNAHDAREAVSWAHVSELKPNPRNPRKHGPEVLKLARTILRTAWGAPIVAQTSTRRIIGGHGRLEAAREILAGIEVDGELRGGAGHWFDRSAPGPEMVPVRWVDVSDAEADAMTLADNARALQGFDDPVAVVEMAAQFGRESETMRDIGLDADALDAMVKAAGDAVLSGDQDVREVDPREERRAELAASWGTALGQRWRIFGQQEHLLVCGDASTAEVREALLQGQRADLCFTDPPYDWPAQKQVEVAFAYSDCAIVSGCGPEYARLAGVAGVRYWFEVISLRKMPRSMPKWPGPFVLHWGNSCFTNGGPHPLHRRHAQGRFGNGDYFPSVRGPYQCGEYDHGQSKAVEWAHELVSMTDARRIADPCSGAGTILLGCEAAGRQCVSAEIDPAFVAVSLQRFTDAGMRCELVD